MKFNFLQAHKAHQGTQKFVMYISREREDIMYISREREDNAQYALYFYKLLTPRKFAIKKVLMIRQLRIMQYQPTCL